MAANKKDSGVIYRCPSCLNGLVDIVLDRYDDGLYHCVKCGFRGTDEDVQAHYAAFRGRYGLIATRITLDEQRKM
jgi:predicted RNA-binding Zn-ribbon protein involved in translation (DUF1610 family)